MAAPNSPGPGSPIGLPTAALADAEVHRADQPIPVTAWVPFTGGRYVQLNAFAGEWTSTAVHLRWRDMAGRHDVWVWANAVHRQRRPGIVGLPATERPGLLAAGRQSPSQDRFTDG